MDNAFHFYDIYPKIVPTKAESKITIQALDRHCYFQEDVTYSVQIVPTNEITADCSKHDYPVLHLSGENHALTFSFYFGAEQKYAFRIYQGEERLLDCSAYAVDSDLYGLLPLKGNMHAHTFHSDGVESPELVAANYRLAGYDFLSITDHERYFPSLEAIKFFQDIDMDYNLLPGEEIHAPRNKIHILGIAGDKSVNEYYQNNPQAYEDEVAVIHKELQLTDCHEDFEYASSVWAFRKIKEFGGMSVLAHPTWMIDMAYNIPPKQYLKFLKEQPFDVLEIINGGDSPAENTEQIAIWQDARCDGCKVPVIATDDSHGTVNGKWFDIGFTYVFAKSNTKEDLLSAMKNGMCVSVERYHNEAPRFYGNYRLISLSTFLYHEYFPIHDELCAREGTQLVDYVKHPSETPKHVLALLKGQVPALQKKYFQ